MTQTQITDAMLFRFFAGQLTEEETARLTAWMDENPKEHQKAMNKAHDIYILGVMSTAFESPVKSMVSPIRNITLSKIIRFTGKIAAVLVIGFAINYVLFTHRVSEWTNQMTTIEAPSGKQIRVTLNDGSVIDLNSGSRIVYPSIFAGKERRIQLYGEAMFDVEPDANRPFIVETFACDVKVLGTHFNVIADEAKNQFSTALFRGKVAVLSHLSNESVLMDENSVVNLKNGHLQIVPIEDPDEYRWPEGIITLNRMSFEQIAEKLERYYDVKIVIERSELPVIKYQSCKIRVSDGINHAMQLLQMASDFTYTYDEIENIIRIK